MNIEKTKIDGVYFFTLQPREDERGFFMRVYDQTLMQDHGLDMNWVQENQAKSIQMHTLRGLHLQMPPQAETKLVRCIKGKIQDVWVDLRKKSSTFGQWDSIILSEENKKMVFIPKGFAHGYLSLEDNSEVIYKVDQAYAPQAEAGILWNDPELGIGWEVDKPILSPKDQKQPTFSDFKNTHEAIQL
ncbi:MAG: dTDP-4-dehydrorhamnose 3,5-epimerase [Candidatus Cyclobacteriaceae bacterium M3_2C_046]